MSLKMLIQVLLAGIILVACGSDPVEPVNSQSKNDGQVLGETQEIEYPNPKQGALNSFVNGDLWESTEASATVSNSILISGVTDEKDIIIIKVEGSHIGEYKLDDTQKNMLGFIDGSNSYFTTKTETATGTLNIVELNLSENWISGTFTATVYSETNDSLQLIGNFEHLELTSTVSTLTLGNYNRFKINNSEFEATYIYHIYITPNLFTITSDNTDSIQVNFFLPFDIQPGTYNLNNTPGNAALCINNVCSNASDAFITINSINRKVNKIEAEYSFTHTHNSISEVTNGTFYLHYWYENGLRP